MSERIKKQIDIEDLIENPGYIVEDTDKEDEDSIIKVMDLKDGSFLICAGHRIFEKSKRLGKERILCEIVGSIQ